MIKVLIIDDHTIVRRGIRQIVEDTPFIEIACEASTCHEARALFKSYTIDVIILDISLPDCSGMDLLEFFKTSKPDIPVIILSIHPEKIYALRALEAGASGYLSKESAPEELITAIQRVADGRKHITATIAEQLATNYVEKRPLDPHESLSKREFQIFTLITQGLTITKIADQLCLSPKTVSTYRARILEKMKLKSNADLIYYAISNNIHNKL